MNEVYSDSSPTCPSEPWLLAAGISFNCPSTFLQRHLCVWLLLPGKKSVYCDLVHTLWVVVIHLLTFFVYIMLSHGFHVGTCMSFEIQYCYCL